MPLLAPALMSAFALHITVLGITIGLLVGISTWYSLKGAVYLSGVAGTAEAKPAFGVFATLFAFFLTLPLILGGAFLITKLGGPGPISCGVTMALVYSAAIGKEILFPQKQVTN